MIQKFINWVEKLMVGEARPPTKVPYKPQHSDKNSDGTAQITTETEKVQAVVEVETPPVTSKKLTRNTIVFRFVIAAVLVGVLIIMLGNYLNLGSKVSTPTLVQDIVNSPQIDESSSNQDSPFSTIETTLEQRTKDILEKMIGVGKVNVLITVESTEEQIIEQNKNESKSITQETDKNGGIREITTTTNDGQVVFLETGGKQEPVITKVINPRIRGVLIVAEGAEDATVRKLIIQAVEKGLNVHQSKISVVPSKI